MKISYNKLIIFFKKEIEQSSNPMYQNFQNFLSLSYFLTY